jgi:molecular chaperone DnaK (HSP70)
LTVRYVIGIDLGTTNSVLAYAETVSGETPRVFAVPQWSSPEALAREALLPSFAYLSTAAERQSGFADAEAPPPENGWIPGIFARERMSLSPGRVIHSAKSWLSNNAVDRTATILPWQSEEVPPAERLSPLQAGALYLAYLRQAWDGAMASGDPASAFEAQDVVVTVPASFDEAAQELTLQAAREAGYPPTVRLLEEPQAAFYDWLGRGRNLRVLLDLLEASAGRPVRILVCDIGGGTTDFSLFEASGDASAAGGLALRRVAVSEHLLLGGDNIDLALAHELEGRLTGGGSRLPGRSWSQLLVQARGLKERILGAAQEEAPSEFTVSVSGGGSSLLSSTLTARIRPQEVRSLVLDGFFPECGPGDRPRKRTSGLREWGLPYAPDTAVTRHLADFLDGRRIDAVLFNGGTVTPDFLRERLARLITAWQEGSAPAVLHGEAPALAVARGAARYALLLRRPDAGGRIAGGHAHALYLEVVKGDRKKSRSLVCVLPKGMEAGGRVRIENAEFDLRVNQPVRFQCFYSNRRESDPPGAVVTHREEDFHPLPPLQTAIHLPPERPRPPNDRLRVTLESSLNELGMLQLYCVETEGPGRWRLDFNLRRGLADEEPVQAPEEPLATKGQLAAAEALIVSLYGKRKDPGLPEVSPRQLPRRMEEALGEKRSDWDSATLRALWPAFAQGMGRQGRSVQHEETWLYLAGFLLRPGYGVELDGARIEELWRLFSMGMVHPKEKRVEMQWHLLWRRVAGGLNAERQNRILKKILPQLQGRDILPEAVYLAGSLERLHPDRKEELVKIFTSGLKKPGIKMREPYARALGRLLSRVPLYGGPETVLPPERVEAFFEQVRGLDWSDPDFAPLNPLFAQAARRTDRRGVDIADQVRSEIIEKMKNSGARREEIRVVRETVPVQYADRERQFGESLPAGLILVKEAES